MSRRPLTHALRLFLAGCLGLVFLCSRPLVTAVLDQTVDPPWIISNEAVVDYPNSVTFRLEVDPAADIVAATLRYDVPQVSCLDVSTEVPVEGSGAVYEWEWVMVRSGNPPPGTTLWWEWDLTDSQGQVTTTARQELALEDDRFTWQAVSEGDMTVHWYEGEEVGPLLLDAAVSGLAVLEEELGMELPAPVDFYIYGSSEDMRDAVLYIQDWAGGVAFSEYSTILMGVPPSIAGDWGRSTVRHELAHLVLEQVGRSCVGGRRPSWLEEGMAMVAEGEPSAQVQRDLENGRSQNSFAPLRSLNGAFPAHDEEASAAYSQSYSVVTFLLETQGEERMQALISELAAGAGYDAALESVYGYNVDGLEQAWRAWMGLPARPMPPTPTPFDAAAVPTFAPLAGPQSLPTPEAAGTPPADAAAQPAAGAGRCAFGLAPLLLLGLFSWRGRKNGFRA